MADVAGIIPGGGGGGTSETALGSEPLIRPRSLSQKKFEEETVVGGGGRFSAPDAGKGDQGEEPRMTGGLLILLNVIVL